MGSVVKEDLQVCPLYFHTGFMTQLCQRNSCLSNALKRNYLTRILAQHFVLTQLDLPLILVWDLAKLSSTALVSLSCP